MNRTMQSQYSVLVEFLGKSLGPDYEVVLHDLGDKSNSIVAIANGHISGRTIGAPLTNKSLEMMAEHQYESIDYQLNYSSLSGEEKTLRSSSLVIKNAKGKPVALLCINFNDARYADIASGIMKLCHPDAFVVRNTASPATSIPKDELASAERFPKSIAAVTESVVGEVVARNGVPVDRLTQDEKMQIVDTLNHKGVFLLKGAVGLVAESLKSSEASIYRYLSKLNRVRESVG
ncbi:PAS domain-containing protein [Spirochaetota bacterium]